jgi:hypothetical protein
MFTVNQSYSATNWPRPNFVQQTTIPSMQNDLWQTSFNNPTDIDLRLQPIHSIPQINEHISPKKTQQQQQRRKRSKKFSKKHHHERETPSSIPIEKSPVLIPNNDEEDDEEERLLREELLRTLSNKRKVKTNSKPERIVTIIPTPSVVINKPVEVSTKSQYSINQRYKRVKANVSLTNVTNKNETTVRTTTTQPIIQTRNKIVRAVNSFI